jgi:putative FmdB family regulatory protein
MPLYEYYCPKCKKTSEVMQKISEPPLKKCSKCGGKVEKLVSATSFHLKGTGWYKTDYATSSSPKKETKKAEKTSDTAPKTKASTD